MGGALASLLLPGCGDWHLFARQPDPVDPVEVVEVFHQQPLPQVDVLWVIDDTASMKDEQAAMADAFGGFIDQLDQLELSWQVGVITTDGTGPDAGLLQGNPWVIHRDLEDPAAAFADAVDVGTDGQSTESGLGAAWLALSEPMISTDNRGFRRPQAALHVVVLSDSDDDSVDILGEDPAGAFLDFLADEAARTGADARLSAIVGPVPEGCPGASPAEIYTAVAEDSGGVVASICVADFSAVAATIADASVAWPTRFSLQAIPEPDSVAVEFDGTLVSSSGYEVEPAERLLVFLAPPPPGVEIRVRYILAEA
ncbi:MAG: hypothetical protein D6798_17820 [Deltaproteobacteria bacterium]|nr:MAG: hypothetical protein D6798_17820 [Deltaproteobacteria bacterium]